MVTKIRGFWVRILKGVHLVNGRHCDFHINSDSSEVDITDRTTRQQLAETAFEAGFICGASVRRVPLYDFAWIKDLPGDDRQQTLFPLPE